jgi:hypothetical protein
VPANSAFTAAARRAVLTLAGALVVGGAVSCGPRDAAQTASPARRRPSEAPTAADLTPAREGFERLQGRWLRADGGYVLEIRAVSPEGRVDASYFNPRPITVARAEAGRGGDIVTLLVELRDVNYPGSTYRLWYDAGSDVLEGTYYQAAQQQTYDVAFERQSR